MFGGPKTTEIYTSFLYSIKESSKWFFGVFFPRMGLFFGTLFMGHPMSDRSECKSDFSISF